MKRMNVTNTPVFRIIGTVAEVNMDAEIMDQETRKFSKSLATFQRDVEKNHNMSLAAILSESTIMQGKLTPKLLEGLKLVGGVAENLSAFREIGVMPSVPRFTQIDKMMRDIYTVLPKVITNIFNFAGKEIEEDAENTPCTNMIATGAMISATSYLTIDRYCKIKGIAFDEKEAAGKDFITEHKEAFNAWVAETIEMLVLNLLENPLEANYVAPIGMKEVVAEIKAQSQEVYDILTDFGSNEPSIKDLRKTEVTSKISQLAPENKNAIVTAIEKFQSMNTLGQVQSGEQTINLPACISMVDALMGMVLHAGETVSALIEGLPETSSASEIMELIEEEEVKTFIDMIANELTDYANTTEIALNMTAIPHRIIPMAIFTNPVFKITKCRELNEMNINIYNLLNKELTKATEEPKEGETNDNN